MKKNLDTTGAFHYDKISRNFGPKINGTVSSQVEIFRSKWSTSRGGPLVSSTARHHPVVKMADGSDPGWVGLLGLIFAGHVPLAFLNPHPIIVYSVAKYTPF